MCKTAFNYDVKKGKEMKPQNNMFGIKQYFSAHAFFRIRVELAAHAWFSSDWFFFFLHQAPLLQVFVNGPLAQTIDRTELNQTKFNLTISKQLFETLQSYL